MASLILDVERRVKTLRPWTDQVPKDVESQIRDALRVPGASVNIVYELAKDKWPDVIGGASQFRLFARKLMERGNGKEVSGSGSSVKGKAKRSGANARRGRKDAAKR